jgi:hypothetical protein
MDMRLGATEVTMLFMVFGSLVTRRNPIPCCPSDGSVTAHNTQHSPQKGKHKTQTWHRLGIKEVFLMMDWTRQCYLNYDETGKIEHLMT